MLKKEKEKENFRFNKSIKRRRRSRNAEMLHQGRNYRRSYFARLSYFDLKAKNKKSCSRLYIPPIKPERMQAKILCAHLQKRTQLKNEKFSKVL